MTKISTSTEKRTFTLCAKAFAKGYLQAFHLIISVFWQQNTVMLLSGESHTRSKLVPSAIHKLVSGGQGLIYQYQSFVES